MFILYLTIMKKGILLIYFLVLISFIFCSGALDRMFILGRNLINKVYCSQDKEGEGEGDHHHLEAGVGGEARGGGHQEVQRVPDKHCALHHR